MKKNLLTAAMAAALSAAVPASAASLIDGASKAWTFQHSTSNGYLSEIVSFDSVTKTLWVAGVSGVDVLDAATGTFLQRIDVTPFGAINSVAVHNGIAAFAIENTADRTQPGVVKLFDTSTRALASGVNSITVGALPDMLTFTKDGSKLLVANEATPNTYGSRIGTTVPRVYGAAPNDPVGSVSIIDMNTRSVSATATLAGVAQTGSHIRSNTGMDFEPEYIAVNAAGTQAYVSLQEANAMGVLNLQTGRFESVIGLGAKDFSLPGNRIDPLNNGNKTGTSGYDLISPNVKGLYMPDGMAVYERNGQTYVLLANEGDFREDDGDRSAASSLGATGTLANLRVSNTDSSAGNLYAAGGRSFSIRATDGTIIYDSGEILDREAMTLGIYNDARSRDKGVEPESVEVMTIGDRSFAFVGLERTAYNNDDAAVGSRVAALAVFDITDPAHTTFVRMLKSDGDMAPEGLEGYVLDGYAYIAFSNEVSSTTSVFRLAPVPEPETYAMLLAGLGLIGLAARRRLG